MSQTRRELIVGGAAAAALVLGGRARAADKKDKDRDEDDVPPTEDLMREHGVLRRIHPGSLPLFDPSIFREWFPPSNGYTK